MCVSHQDARHGKFPINAIVTLDWPHICENAMKIEHK